MIVRQFLLLLLTVGVILFIAYLFYLKQQFDKYFEIIQPSRIEAQLDGLTEVQQAKLYLYYKVGQDYATYKKIERIFECESNWNLYAFNSKTKDAGLAQINIPTWDKTAQQLGYDYKNNPEDNIDFALWILENVGVKAWKYSRHCHKVYSI